MINPVTTSEQALAELKRLGITLPPAPLRLTEFGNSSEMSQELLALIRSGRKTAGSCLLWSLEAEGEPVPSVGDIEIVLDHLKRPSIVYRIVESVVLPFDQITDRHARLEGEGDLSLDYWRRVHWDFFARECAELGREPSEQMPVQFGAFEVLHLLGT